MKEFLDNLYKQCVHSRRDGIDQLYDVVPILLEERKFDVLNGILIDMDLARVTTSVMYSLVHFTSDYINQLPHYREFYSRVREEFARRRRPEKEIKDLFDKYRDGGDRLFDPNAPPYKSPDRRDSEKLDAKIAWARSIGDKDLENYLTWYKADRQNHIDKDNEFRHLMHTAGEEEMRKRTIKALRDMADLLDKSTSCWPGIYYCSLPDDPLMKKTFIDGINVVISYPWPG